MKVAIVISFLINTFLVATGDGQRGHGENCSFKSQVANIFRENDSPNGCMTDRGLVCLRHKCVCDPTSIYAEVMPTSDSSADSGVRGAIGDFLTKKFSSGGSGSTTEISPPPPESSNPAFEMPPGGRCLGRAGSPCLTEKSACVQHAACQGSPRVCKCQGLYSPNLTGHCSKTATVAHEVIKRIG